MSFKHAFLLVPALAFSLALAACDNNGGDTKTSQADAVNQINPAAGEVTTLDAAPVEAAPAETTADAVPGGVPGTAEGLAPADAMAAPAETAPDGTVPTPAEPEKTCGHQDLVGKTKAEIDTSTFNVPVRILYPNSQATMDYNPDRVNIILEEGTDRVTEVRCG